MRSPWSLCGLILACTNCGVLGCLRWCLASSSGGDVPGMGSALAGLCIGLGALNGGWWLGVSPSLCIAILGRLLPGHRELHCTGDTEGLFYWPGDCYYLATGAVPQGSELGLGGRMCAGGVGLNSIWVSIVLCVLIATSIFVSVFLWSLDFKLCQKQPPTSFSHILQLNGASSSF